MTTKPKVKKTAEPAEAKAKSGVTVSNSARLDPKNPIPIEMNGMGFYSRSGGRYVPFLDGLDNMPQTMLEAKLLSPTTMACVNSKTIFSLGGGYKLLDVEEDKTFTEWAKVVNKKSQSFNDILRSCFDYHYTFGNIFIDVVRVKVGTSKYVKLFVKSALDCRLAMPDDGDVAEFVLVSKEFRKTGVWNMKAGSFMEIPIYTGEKGQPWFKDNKGNEHAIIYLKNDIAGYDYYGLPSNIASLPQQILEYKGARFNMDAFDNNLVIGGMIAIEGNMTQPEADKLGKSFVHAHSGDGKRGRFVIAATEGGVNKVSFTPFTQQKDGDYIKLDERIEEKIILANEWSKTLIDPQAKGFGNSSKQIKETYEAKKTFVIEPAQNFLIEKFINPLMNICDEFMGTKWSQHQFGFDNKSPVSFVGDLDINSILTVDEGRNLINMLPLENNAGQVLIAPAQQKTLQEGGGENV